MTIIAEITVPADRFELGRILREFSEIRVELERVVPLQDATIPLVWVSNVEAAAVEATLRDHPQIRTVNVLTTAHGATLFDVEWGAEFNGLVRTLVETQATLLEASGDSETWDFRLRFPSHENLAEFNQTATDDGIPVMLRRLSNPVIRDERPQLSAEQRTALMQAYHHGYFEIPRRVGLREIADQLGISDSALSQRLRRGITTLVEQTLLADEFDNRDSVAGQADLPARHAGRNSGGMGNLPRPSLQQ